MTPFEAYKTYLGLKQHFTSPSYDYFKYNGKVNAKAESFEKRRDRFQFTKLGKQRDPVGLLVSNFVSRNPTWVGDIVDDSGIKTYLEWSKRNQSLHYLFTQELSAVTTSFDEALKIAEGETYPPLLQLYFNRKISIETLLIICQISGCVPYWNKKIKDPIQWPNLERKLLKYSPFLQYDKEKFKKTLVDYFQD